MAAAKKTVLIIGFGPAGSATLAALNKAKDFPRSTHRIVVVAPAYAYTPIGALRASVVPGWEDRVVAPIEAKKVGLTADDVLVPGEIKQLDLENKVATFDGPRQELGGDHLLHYDFVVIATGSLYKAPMRPPTSVKTVDQAKAFLKKLQGQVASAQKILIVGTGPVGVEFAGEVASHFGAGAKSITLVGSEERLFSAPQWKPALGSKLAAQFEKLQVNIVYGAKADLKGLETGAVPKGTKVKLTKKDGTTQEIETDYIHIGTGTKPNNALFSSSLLDPSTGRLKTTPYLSLPSHPTAYALGDIVDRDVKMAAAVPPQAAVVATNLIADIKGSGKKVEAKDFMTLIAVPLGPKGGAIQMFGFVFQQWVTSMIKGKDLFTGAFLKGLGQPA